MQITEEDVPERVSDGERDPPSPAPSSPSSVQKELSIEGEEPVVPTVLQRKRICVSKKEVPDYLWTDDGTRRLADFVKDHPMLFDKKQKDWLNVASKSLLWQQAGDQQEPPATGMHVSILSSLIDFPNEFLNELLLSDFCCDNCTALYY